MQVKQWTYINVSIYIIDISFIKKRLKERCINNAGKTMDIYKCII
jgi:hypothetical protein